MKVIHGGTVVQSTFHVVDEDGNVVNSVNAVPSQDNVEDPLRIKVLSEDSFAKAYEAILKIKTQLVERIEQGTEISAND